MGKNEIILPKADPENRFRPSTRKIWFLLKKFQNNTIENIKNIKEKNGDINLIPELEEEILIYSKYLPKQLNEEELTVKIKDIVSKIASKIDSTPNMKSIKDGETEKMIPYAGILPVGNYIKEKYGIFRAGGKAVKNTLYFTEITL